MSCDQMFKFGLRVEYAPEKEEQHRKKHKYSLSCAQYVIDRMLLPLSGLPSPEFIAESPRNGEERWKMMAKYEGKTVFIVYTWRCDEGEDICRIISMRAASDKEAEEFNEALVSFFGLTSLK